VSTSRQLAAIMFTDIEGYTALMQKDEQLAIQMRTRHRDIFNSITEKHHGKILQYYGDGTLSMFNSVVDAVSCGVELQQSFLAAPEIPVRIGIHSGDITILGDEIAGDGVNIASRIESLAGPGSVLISRRVYDEIKNHSKFNVVSVGRIPLKNVRNPMVIYALANEGLKVPDRSKVRKMALHKMGIGSTRKRVLMAAIVLFVITFLYGAFLWYQQNQTHGENLGPKSIAVLPFVNLSKDSSQEYFSDGMTADLLSQLARVKDLRVVSRTSVMQYKNTDKSLKQIAEELNATHILEGSVIRHHDQVRIAINLIEAKTDNPIWSVDFDRDVKDVLKVQREVSLEVVKLLKADLTEAERSRVEKIATTNERAYDYYQKGQNLIRRTQGTINQLDEAVRLFEEAIKLDPNFSLAYVGLADTYLSYAAWGRISPKEALPKARAAAHLAQDLDDQLGESYQTLGAIYLHQQDHETAALYLHKALDLSPSYVETYSWLAKLNLLQGNSDEAVRFFREAQDLDPLSTLYTGYIIWAYYINGEYEKAIEVSEEVLVEHPTDSFVLWSLANVYIGKQEHYKAIEILKRRNIGSNNWTMGYAYGRLGEYDEARKILNYNLKKAKDDYVPAMMISTIYLGLNEQDKALLWLEKAIEEGIAPIMLPEVTIGPKFAPLRSDPRFQEIMARAKLRQS